MRCFPTFDIRENFVGPDATINSSNVEQFCAAAGTKENFLRLRGMTTSRRQWILPPLYLLEGSIYSFFAYLILKIA